MGAIKERVQKHQGGWLVNISDGASGVIEKLEELLKSDIDIQNMQNFIKDSAQSYLRGNTKESMVTKYKNVYLKAISEI